jgi:aryl-alcohol dehydrogenase-like predicted oxidoreductase
MSPLPGRATPEGTRCFRGRFPSLPDASFRSLAGLTVSTLGIGTYLGAPTDEVDARYASTLREMLSAGGNLVDTAIGYRCQRSERLIGRLLSEKVAAGEIGRDEIVVCTKGGYVAHDGAPPADPAAWLRQNVIDAGLAREEEIVDDSHSLAVPFLARQIDTSLANLGVETIDVYYLWNPERQLVGRPRPLFEARVEAAFALLEERCAAGQIGIYGTATWGGYRIPPSEERHLELEDLLRLAERAGGRDHHFRVVELPFGLALPEALALPTQRWRDRIVPPLSAFSGAGLAVTASGPLLHGRSLGKAPSWALAAAPQGWTEAQASLQFCRSAPGITAALVGTSRPEHARENFAILSEPPWSGARFREIVTHAALTSKQTGA